MLRVGCASLQTGFVGVFVSIINKKTDKKASKKNNVDTIDDRPKKQCGYQIESVYNKETRFV